MRPQLIGLNLIGTVCFYSVVAKLSVYLVGTLGFIRALIRLSPLYRTHERRYYLVQCVLYYPWDPSVPFTNEKWKLSSLESQFMRALYANYMEMSYAWVMDSDEIQEGIFSHLEYSTKFQIEEDRLMCNL